MISTFVFFQLFRLLTGSDHCFEDEFINQPIVASYIRRKLAPETVATHRGELIALLEGDQLALKNLKGNEEITSAKASIQNTTKESKAIIFIS